ncbi:CD3Z antigen, zeta polypeptide b [Xenopus laevis]|uniref:T-cell surface glycoprotein CD3 zeta chain n=1 Tax=Xenopus laevis TaxID=8355 RepID=B1NA61_XENLA|nr:CD3Z antigen, zeta polypeptide b [Xenopus laevis]ABR19648.1 ITAM-bearing signaling subunit [Xenopus laevis]
MKSRWIAFSTFLQAQVLSTDAQIFGLTDPRLCYILDGLLFIYAVIVTALFFREKLSQKIPEPIGYRDSNYAELNPRDQGKYDVLNVRGEEKATRRQKHPEADSTYTGLQRDKMSDPYSDIRTKQPQKRQVKKNDPVYQGLNSGSRDTYDALHMQPLPPLP